jgi:predicted  nucleic acid-binding Zn-ribbon protein
MSLLEIEHLLNEKRRNDKLNRLEQAYYMACLVNNEKANETYTELRYEILGIDKQLKLKKDIARYKVISERLKLKFPA